MQYRPSSEVIPVRGNEAGEIHIHTSDRSLFRRCRRKWGFQSQLRFNLATPQEAAPANPHLWFGSGIHYALEDYHGYNVYGNPILAFQAYCWATRSHLPDDYKELVSKAEGILTHYGDWAKRRDDVKTWWFQAEGDPLPKPMVEVQWSIPLFDDPPVFYSGTFDRIVIDPHGRFWILDYKTAQRFNTSKLPMDPQVSAYCWAFRQLYGVNSEGLIYVQILKEAPHLPWQLENGTFSCNKTQNTTYALYRAALIAKYGNEKSRIPRKNLEFAAWLREQETPEGDKFIRRDLVRRNDSHIESEEWKIYAETAEMLNPDLPLYPNATRDCSWDCDFIGPCLAMDDGSDYETILAEAYVQRGEINWWRQKLPSPDHLLQLRQQRFPVASESELKLLFRGQEPELEPQPQLP